MRLYTLVVSIVAHAAALILLVIVPLAAMDALPNIRVVPEFVAVTAAELPEVPPPPQRTPQPATADVRSDVAPISAPDRIEPEVPRTPAGPAYDGPPGIPHGDPAGEPLLSAAPPIPAPPVPKKPVRQGGDIRPPAKTRHVAPLYPPIAIASKVEGVVILEVVIGENGRVQDVRVLRSRPLLDQAAVDAVRQWQFTPTLLNGEPVPIVMTVTVSFQLK